MANYEVTFYPRTEAASALDIVDDQFHDIDTFEAGPLRCLHVVSKNQGPHTLTATNFDHLKDTVIPNLLRNLFIGAGLADWTATYKDSIPVGDSWVKEDNLMAIVPLTATDKRARLKTPLDGTDLQVLYSVYFKHKLA